MSRECAIAGCNFIEVDGDPIGLMGMHMAAAHKEPCGHAIRVRDCVGCERMHAMPTGPLPSDASAWQVQNPDEFYTFVAYRTATIALRDAELALKAAQEGYRRALEALNKAIAPFPSEATK